MKTTRFSRILASGVLAGALVVGVGSALPASAHMVADPGVIQVDPCLLHPETCPGQSNPGDTPTTLPTPPTTQPQNPTTTTPTNPDVVKAKPAFTG